MPEIKKLNRVSQGAVRIIGVSSGEIRPVHEKQNVIIHTDGIPVGGQAGDLLAKRTDANYDTEWKTPANIVEQDNTNPITSAAVYTEIGNINALLSAI